MSFLETILACPRCNKPIAPKRTIAICVKCKLSFKKYDSIWHCLYISNNQSKESLKQYESMHTEQFGGPNDGSYEILASIARGNRTVDIACGEGLIEKFSPETVGVEFSLNALKKAKANGAKYLVLADAHALPFRDNSFDIAICAGSLEHFYNPHQVISEMARISKIQVLTVHKELPFPFAKSIHQVTTKILRLTHQPIEQPISQKNLERMIKKVGLSIIFKGVWTLPVNYGRPIRFLPEFKKIPSCWFVISIKKTQKSKVKTDSVLSFRASARNPLGISHFVRDDISCHF